MSENDEPIRTEDRTLQQQVRIYRRKCAHCGQEFEGTGKQRYCRAACRVAAYDARHPEKAKERRRLAAARRRQRGDGTKTAASG